MLQAMLSLDYDNFISEEKNTKQHPARGVATYYSGSLNPLSLNIKEQIPLSCLHTFLTKVLGRSYHLDLFHSACSLVNSNSRAMLETGQLT